MIRLIAISLVLALFPGTAEAVENVVHLVSEGDHAHALEHVHPNSSAQQNDDEHSSDEHGCSSVFHLCGCHTAPTFIPQTEAVRQLGPAAILPNKTPLTTGRLLCAADATLDGLFRPPID